MKKQDFDILKSSGKRVKFSLRKLQNSLRRSGADDKTIEHIIDTVRDELYQGISTKEIYNRAFALLKKQKSVFASKYKLKKAIYELGPTGFPFESFVAAILKQSGYQVNIGQIISGKCVSHEVDVVAKKNTDYIVIECKFHSEEGRNCNVKIPLYIHSRYQDILNNFENKKNNLITPNQGWVVTNTRFTKDAIQYGECAGLYLLSWDYPKANGLKDRIDRLGLYPITVSTLLTNREKQFLLSRDIVLCKQLRGDMFYLDHLGISEKRKQKILDEINKLCNE
ncbi:restriction endonuclease [uncultured Aquimarina sp.]|uniref:ATP cone domain-containing protein n=1 Tax=uncultured Aquimarina sp. TaxID=575652 RepID=UPI0026127C53|nr:restriction endonuclease [uncultured Aquimarina sp.]